MYFPDIIFVVFWMKYFVRVHFYTVVILLLLKVKDQSVSSSKDSSVHLLRLNKGKTFSSSSSSINMPYVSSTHFSVHVTCLLV